MIFTQPIFFLFFAAVYGVYWALPANRPRKLYLLLMSYVFYSSWDWRFGGLIFVSTLIDYIAGAMLGREKPWGGRRLWIGFSIAANLGILGFFKYFNFFIESADRLLEMVGLPHSPTLQIILPVGVSFYTFQSMSYTLDIYRGDLKPVRSFTDFALFVSFFPQLVAGPIVRAADFLPQLQEARSRRDVALKWALALFAIGFFKKACLADRIGPIIDPIFASPDQYSVSSIHLAGIFFLIQIYCDFSGYSDMAIALAALLGYRLPLNFYFPLLSRNPREFWRRWHISMITWFRDYVFIALGGSRRTALRTGINVLLTCALSGLWHGASWTMVLWGMMNGVVLIGHQVATRRLRAGPRLDRLLQGAGVLGTVTFVAWSGYYFRAESFSSAWIMSVSALLLRSPGATAMSPGWFLALVPLFLAHWLAWKADIPRLAERSPDGVFYFLLGVSTILILMFVQVDVQPFIYFQF